jgi:hypothetical protein
MTNFDLPTISPGAAPEFTDASGCAKWLQALPLINVGPSHDRLLGQLEELNGYNVAAAERLKILELLREPVTFVQKEHAKKFSNRPVPLSKQERDIFRNVNSLWDALSFGYQHCLQAVVGGASGLNGQVALMCQRVLWCTGQKMVDCYQAYLDIEEHDWKLLHRVYALAEERDVAGDDVAHPVHKGKAETTCVETYAHVLLLSLANPGKLTPRQIELISRWLDRWARKATIARTPATAGDGAPPLVVDLASGAGASHDPAEGEAVRYLEIHEVGRSVRKRIGLLRKGEPPAALGLGEDIAAPLAESLLVMLYKRWCEEKQTRVHPRRNASGSVQICAGMDAMYFFVTGRGFRGQAAAQGLSQVQHEQIATLGRIVSVQEANPAAAANFPVESWVVRDQSASGFRLERTDPAATSRLILNQLLGIRLPNAKNYLLCAVRWLSVSPEFEPHIGVQILPGVPVGVSIRPAGVTSEKPVPALMLPASAALQSPDSLVLPSGWFKPERVVEIETDAVRKLRLTELIERGADFERVGFAAA